jgi:hypothetical protein
MEKSLIKGLTAAARLHGLTLDEAMSLVVVPGPGPKGWMDSWAAKAAQEKRHRAREAGLARYEAAREAARAREEANKLLPEWRVLEKWGAHSFSNELFGAIPYFGGGQMTFADADEACKKFLAKHAKKIATSNEYWDAYMNW